MACGSTATELLPGGYDTRQAREVLKAVCDRGLIDFADLDVAVEPMQLKYGMPPVFVKEHFYRPMSRRCAAPQAMFRCSAYSAALPV